MNSFRTVLAVLSLALMAPSVNAAFLTSNTISNPAVIDFDAQPVVTSETGPIQIGTPVGLDIEWSAEPNDQLFVSPSSWGLVDNGNWGTPMTFLAAEDTRPGAMIFAFNSGPVAEVGAFMNYCPNGSCGAAGDLVISALDDSMAVLETYNVTDLADIVTPGGFNEGAFRGISRPTADIHYFRIDTVIPVVDDLTFSSPAVATNPVPSSSPWALFLLVGALGLVGLLRARAS